MMENLHHSPLVRYSVLLLAALLLAGASGCKQQQNKREKPGALSDTLRVGNMVVPVTDADRNCLANSKSICPMGISGILLGAPLTSLKEEAKVLSDVQVNTPYGVAREIVLADSNRIWAIPGAKRYVQDSVGETQVETDMNVVGMLAAISPGLMAENQLHVGSTFAEALAIVPEQKLLIYYYPGRRQLFFYDRSHDNIHYIIQDIDGAVGKKVLENMPKNLPSYRLTPDFIPPDFTIQRILVRSY